MLISSPRISWIVAITLGLVSTVVAQDKRAILAIDTSQTRAPLQPYIYGQFIEHLGRCIYGGVWAEMLEDRKFYFPITANYDPYKSLEETPFPVVGASPWRIIGDPAGVTMDPHDSFVGDHTPHVRRGSGIEQLDLALQEGREYEGHVWLKGKGTVTLSLAEGEDADPRQIASFDLTGDYQKYTFQFAAETDTEHATLQINIQAEGAAHIGAVSLMPQDNVRGMRADTLALLKELDAPIYRWPGGNFVSGYDWRDGIGPRDRRPPRKNPAWTGVEHNDMGIDEFIGFCREVATEPMIAANTGFGDAYSAAQEVEYCNGSNDTIGGSWRAKNGAEQPYNVKYWCVGNEMFGPWQLGYMKLEHYTLKHNDVARAMWDVDPKLVLVGVGDLGGQNSSGETGWSEGMLQSSRKYMDMISEHFYTGRTPWTDGGKSSSVAAHVAEMRRAIRSKAAGHRKLQDKMGLTGDRRLPIAMDEWNYWHRDYVYGELGCRYDLADALGVAVGLNEYARNTDIIHMAHYAQTVNVIGCIKTTKTDAFLATTALPLMLYRKHFGVTPVAAEFDSGANDLDVAAALDDDGKVLALGVVNPAPEPATIELRVKGSKVGDEAEQWTVGGDDPRAYNEVDQQRVDVEHSRLQLEENWTAPAYSFSILRVAIEEAPLPASSPRRPAARPAESDFK